jgi:hypothetical protein
MIKALLDPRSAVKAAPLAGLSILLIGGLVGAQGMAEKLDKDSQTSKAHDRYENCLVVEGRVIAGLYYSQKTTVEGGKKERETLLPDGQRICDKGGGTAQISGSVAAFYRADDPNAAKEALKKRFEVTDENGQTKLVIPPEMTANLATAWKADISKRGPVTIRKKPNFWEGLFTAPKH